jgi:hypothetical protein
MTAMEAILPLAAPVLAGMLTVRSEVAVMPLDWAVIWV